MNNYLRFDKLHHQKILLFMEIELIIFSVDTGKVVETFENETAYLDFDVMYFWKDRIWFEGRN